MFSFLFALAQVSPPSPDEIQSFAQSLLSAVMGGKWPIVAALALVTIVWGVRKSMSRWAFTATDHGAFSINLATSFALAIATALFAGGWHAVTLAVVLKALEMSFLAAGGWAAVTKFGVPLLGKIPALSFLLSPKADGPRLVTAAQPGLVAPENPVTSDQIANGQ